MDRESVRQYASPLLGSNMYLCCRGGEALAIDPHVSGEALAYLREQGARRALILLTHEHYDHTSGVTWLAGELEATVVCQRFTAESLRLGRNNRPIVLAARSVGDEDKETVRARMRALPQGYTYQADQVFDGELRLTWQGVPIRLTHTPGHSPGSCCVELGGGMVATGDSLIYGTPVITRFPGGREEDFVNRTLPYLQRLREGTWILPGHGKTFRLRPEDLEVCRSGKRR